MKYLVILTSFFSLLGCKTNADALHITVVKAAPVRITREVPETEATQTYNTYQEVTERFVPAVYLKSKEDNLLKFTIQGNISSQGLQVRHISKISFEQGEQFANGITLKYYVNIKHIAGKESATTAGYNYIQEKEYKIPKDVKVINVEVYEEHPNQEPKLIAKKKFDFFAKI